MFQTAFTLNLTHFARALSLPERLQRTPGRNMSLEALRQRNTTVDAFFYDIKVVTPDEAFYISDSLAAVGSLLIVPPSGAGPLTLCDTLDEFFMRGGSGVQALAIAGAGGSALGAAAFARNVADAIGAPVAAVVPGYGLADAVSEAFGGAFLFGWLNQIRSDFEVLDKLSGRPQFGVDPHTNAAASSAGKSCLDVQTVLALLADPRLSLQVLAAHSKGSVVLCEALDHLDDLDAGRLAEIAAAARIVTFGAGITMPPAFADVTDVIGEWDWYGRMNSRAVAGTGTQHSVRGAWHHTNTDLPGHLSVTQVLEEILAMPASTAVAETHGIAETPSLAPATVLALVPAVVDATAGSAETIPDPIPAPGEPAFDAVAEPGLPDVAADAAPDEPMLGVDEQDAAGAADEPAEVSAAVLPPAASDMPAKTRPGARTKAKSLPGSEPTPTPPKGAVRRRKSTT